MNYINQVNPLKDIEDCLDHIEKGIPYNLKRIESELAVEGLNFLALKVGGIADYTFFEIFHGFIGENAKHKPRMSKYLEIASGRRNIGYDTMYSKLSYFGYLDYNRPEEELATTDYGYTVENGFGLWDIGSYVNDYDYGIFFSNDWESYSPISHDPRLVEYVILSQAKEIVREPAYKLWGLNNEF